MAADEASTSCDQQLRHTLTLWLNVSLTVCWAADWISVTEDSVSQLQSLRGMVDLLPLQTRRWQAVEAAARAHFRRSGIEEIRTPLLEVTDLFARGIGESTDVVGKEMYSFQDRGDRACTLRPEGTASAVRAVLQHGLLSQGPQKLWYCGPMFRYERPQAGRQRQFHQIGVEWLGVSSARSDAEVIALAWDLLELLGVSGLELQINSLGTLEDRQRYRSELVAWLQDRAEQLDPDSKQRLTTNPLRILDSKNPQTQMLLAEAPTLLGALCDQSTERFQAVQVYLQGLEIPFRVNTRLVRGLDYYGHTAFEITSNQLGAQATVCGGGRYDGLVEQLGGPSTPAIGWALGMERLLLVLEAASIADPDGAAARLSALCAPDLYLVNRGQEAEASALLLARQLRLAGLSVELDGSGSSFAKQFKRADRSRAGWAAVIGDDEFEAGQLCLKPLLAEGEEIRVALDDPLAVVAIMRTNT